MNIRSLLFGMFLSATIAAQAQENADNPTETQSLPEIYLDGQFGYNYSPGKLTLSFPGTSLSATYDMKAKWRGGQTNGSNRHKRNFHVKLTEADGTKLNASLLGMRSDNSWLLDAGQIDLGRIRNTVAHKIWRDMGTKPYYATIEKKARNYVESEFCEVFVGDSYEGIYALTEAIDRKQMRLMRYDEQTKTLHGMLWKATGWSNTTMWAPFSQPDNNSNTWEGFEAKYPDFDEAGTDWRVLYNALKFVNESNEADFAADVCRYFDVPVLVDYFIFHNMIGAIDHGGKNVYWACYDMQAQNPILTPAIWDYDTSLGQFIDNKNPHSDEYGPETGDFKTHAAPKVIYRLVAENATDFAQKAVNRYWQLRQTVFSEERFTAYYSETFKLLEESGAAEREEQRWSYDSDIDNQELDFATEKQYIANYIHRRLEYLDKVFTSTTSIRNAVIDDNSKPQKLYNVAGQQILQNAKGVIIVNGKKLFKR